MPGYERKSHRFDIKVEGRGVGFDIGERVGVGVLYSAEQDNLSLRNIVGAVVADGLVVTPGNEDARKQDTCVSERR